MDGGKLQLTSRVVALAAITAVFVFRAAGNEPTVEAKLLEKKVKPGQPFVVQYTVRWSGEADAFAVQAPTVESPSWGTATLGPARGRIDQGTNVVEFDIVYMAKEPGEFATPELNIEILRPEVQPHPERTGSDVPPTAPEVLPTLSTPALSLKVRQPKPLIWISGALGALFLLAGGVWAVRRRARPTPPRLPSSPSTESVESYLREASIHRVEGRIYEFYGSLADAAIAAGADAEEVTRLQQRAQEAGYTAERPPDDALDADYRAVQRLAARNMPEAWVAGKGFS